MKPWGNNKTKQLGINSSGFRVWQRISTWHQRHNKEKQLHQNQSLKRPCEENEKLQSERKY